MPLRPTDRRNNKRRFRLRLPQRRLKLHIAFWLLASEILIGTVGFMILEGYDPIEAFYMVIITISNEEQLENLHRMLEEEYKA